MRFAEKDSVVFLQIQTGKQLSLGLVEPWSLKWQEPPEDRKEDKKNLLLMDYRNRRLALDEVFLDGHALTGLQIIKYRDLFMLKIKGSKLTNNGTKVSKED